MSARILLASLIALALGQRAAVAEDEPGGDKLVMQLENVTQEQATFGQFTARGKLPFLPKGTILYVTLQVLNRTPPIEAAVVKIECVEGGAYLVEHVFPNAVLAPIGYEARVVLHMDAQPKQIKDQLKRELGYRGNDVVLLASRPHHLGTIEERVAYARATLETLLEHAERAAKFHARVGAVKKEEWEQGKEPIANDLGASFGEFRTWHRRYVCLYEHALKGTVEQCYLGLDRSFSAREDGDDAAFTREMNAVRDLVQRVRADIQARLAEKPEKAGQPEKEKKKQ